MFLHCDKNSFCRPNYYCKKYIRNVIFVIKKPKIYS